MMKLVLPYIKEKRKTIFVLLFCGIVIKAIAFLYGAKTADTNYALFICFVGVGLIACADFVKYVGKYRKLEYLKRQLAYEIEEFPEPERLFGADVSGDDFKIAQKQERISFLHGYFGKRSGRVLYVVGASDKNADFCHEFAVTIR